MLVTFGRRIYDIIRETCYTDIATGETDWQNNQNLLHTDLAVSLRMY